MSQIKEEFICVLSQFFLRNTIWLPQKLVWFQRSSLGFRNFKNYD